jgi:hypothetical protein
MPPAAFLKAKQPPCILSELSDKNRKNLQDFPSATCNHLCPARSHHTGRKI